MTRRSARVLALVTLGVAPLAGACGKGAAEQALAAANNAVEQAKPEIEKYVPDQLKAITDGLGKAKADFHKGDYKRALTAAQELLPRVQSALEAAKTTKDELIVAFNQLRESLPKTLAALKARLGALARMTTLPSDLDQATVEAAMSNLATVAASWAQAAKSFDSGDVIAAVKQGSEVRTALEEMTSTFMPAAAAAKAAR